MANEIMVEMVSLDYSHLVEIQTNLFYLSLIIFILLVSVYLNKNN